VTRLVPLDGRDIAIGHRFQIKQPRLPKLLWQVTDVAPGRSWTWEQRSPGGLTLAHHELTPKPDGRTLVRQRIDQGGFIGGIVGLLMRRMTQRYLELEAAGLKARCEQRHRDGSHS
jgi:hypothetical protein